MLHLAGPTPDGWAERVASVVDEVLLDHAHCERKAASTALSLIFRYTDRGPLMQPLSALAREELEHFELVLSHLERRGGAFRRQRPSAYAGRLMEVVRQEEPHRLLDMLLACSMIEARSCERMQLFATVLDDAPLRAMYEGLLASEARHHVFYVDLATTLFGAEVAPRLEIVAAHEYQVILTGPPEDRLHG